MNSRTRFVTAALLLGLAGLGVILLLQRTSPHTSGPLPHEVYVWQRAWNAPVRAAISAHATNFARVVPLAAEITWKDQQPRLIRVALDYSTLANLQRPIGLALRIGPYSGTFTTNDATVRFIANAASAITAEARTNGIKLSELQIDFDCAESKLAGYHKWLRTIQDRVAPIPVTITALPSWLNARDFKAIAQTASNYVLQVHSLERPKGADVAFALCDPVAARRAVERAGRIGIPFRVALPTYGYTLAFQHDGKFLGLSAEGARPNWPTNALIREVSSNPLELAALVADWTASRPTALRGVIWYRLPTTGDRFNWRWPTLGAIVAARFPQESFRAEARRVEPGLVEISLVNTGELDLPSRLTVTVHWSNARLVAADALAGFELTEQTPSRVRLWARPAVARPLRPGEQQKIGWLRFDRDSEVTCESEKN